MVYFFYVLDVLIPEGRGNCCLGKGARKPAYDCDNKDKSKLKITNEEQPASILEETVELRHYLYNLNTFQPCWVFAQRVMARRAGQKSDHLREPLV